MKTAYSYLRWSTRVQGKNDRDSRTRQTKSARDWIKNNGNGKYHLSDEVFVDAGKSGFSGKHVAKDGDLNRFIELVERGTIKRDSILLIDEFSRFSRLQPTKALTLFMRVIDSGIGLVFTGSFDKRVIDSNLIDKDGYVLQFIIGEMIRSHSESAEKSRKVKSAKKKKLEDIRSGQIVKHNTVPKYFSWSESEKRYVHNHKTQIIKRLVEMYLDGHSLYGIAKQLNSEGIESIKRLSEWSPRSVKSILQSRALLGEYLGAKNFFPAIIDQDKFDRLQVVLKQNTTNKGKPADLCNMFKGLMYCKCGKAMHVVTQSFDYKHRKKKQRVYRYVRCGTVGSGGTSCDRHKMMNLDWVEQLVFSESLQTDPNKFLGKDDSTETRELRKLQLTKERELNSTSAEISKLVELSNSIQLEELKTKLTKVEKRREQIREEISSLNIQLADSESTSEKYDDWKRLEMEGTLKEIDDASLRLIATLQDNDKRMKLRTLLPSILQKIVCDPSNQKFWVFNRSGKVVFESFSFNQVFTRGEE